jgi:hypothetical protein
MKKLVILPSLLVLLLGCKTFNQPTSPEILQFVANRARDAASIATAIAVKSHPEYRVAFEAGVIALDGLLQTTNYNSADFKGVLKTLPMWNEWDQALGDYGGLALDLFVTVFDIETTFGYKIEAGSALKLVMIAVKEGVASGLSATPKVAASLKVAKTPEEVVVVKKVTFIKVKTLR